jgi:hypothetical protein
MIDYFKFFFWFFFFIIPIKHELFLFRYVRLIMPKYTKKSKGIYLNLKEN